MENSEKLYLGVDFSTQQVIKCFQCYYMLSVNIRLLRYTSIFTNIDVNSFRVFKGEHNLNYSLHLEHINHVFFLTFYTKSMVVSLL